MVYSANQLCPGVFLMDARVMFCRAKRSGMVLWALYLLSESWAVRWASAPFTGTSRGQCGHVLSSFSGSSGTKVQS
uniref:Uncharacterized protein n=1 Tax=Anguilla anguilla TaxID=7936 RepID=A0A0E9W8X4_ANGAN